LFDLSSVTVITHPLKTKLSRYTTAGSRSAETDQRDLFVSADIG